MSDREYWHEVNTGEKASVYVEQWTGDIIAIAKPEGYDYWNIYDSSDHVVEGHSLGPFSTHDAAVKRVQEDISEFHE
jgi:hypothetical protein